MRSVAIILVLAWVRQGLANELLQELLVNRTCDSRNKLGSWARHVWPLHRVDLDKTVLWKRQPVQSCCSGISFLCTLFHKKHALGPPAPETKYLPRTTWVNRLWSAVTAQVDPPLVTRPGRPPYALTGESRPRFRGAAYLWLHRTGVWYLVAMAYVSAMFFSHLSLPAIGLRILVACATSLNVWLSDGYHNADLRSPGALSMSNELKWPRGDVIGTSLVISTTLWLWSSNVGWIAGLKGVGVASGVATTLIALLSLTAAPKNVSMKTIMVVIGVQFVIMLGYLQWTILTNPALVHTFRFYTLIYWIYAPGFLLFVIGWPRRDDFGYHEYFHTSVLCGHVASIVFDIVFGYFLIKNQN